MTKTEALEWIRGERSWTNVVPPDPYDTWQARIAFADAASVQRAYWVLRAHAEGLVEEPTEGGES
jgi:hypothetical protein